jgi:protein-glutamine gamma-glutamyltransferase
MIRILRKIIEASNIINHYPLSSIEAKVLNILSSSRKIYDYISLEQLKFELSMRDSIVGAAQALFDSNVKFKTFNKSMCNTEYWERTEKGGFLLKKNVSPFDAISDIFTENSSKYGTECSTTIIILYYKALLSLFPEELFNRVFKNIHLLNWHYIDPNLEVRTYIIDGDYLPGDCRYFKNPDVSPEEEEWRGENAIDMGNGKYFGHGIGIEAPETIISALNRHRKEGSTESAYITDFVTSPNFKYLWNLYQYFLFQRLWSRYYDQLKRFYPYF